MISRLPQWQPADFSADAEARADGSLLLTPRAPLGPYPARFTDAVEEWAAATPEQTMVARRDGQGAWQRVSYRDALIRMRHLAAGLSALPLSVERPLLILSGNSIEHMLLGLAAMYVGVPFCPVSPAYSQASSDLGKLRYVVELLTPGMVAAFAEQGRHQGDQHAGQREYRQQFEQREPGLTRQVLTSS